MYEQHAAAATDRLISDAYRDLNRKAHEADPGWGSTAARFATTVRELAEALGSWDVLDYGCGKRSLQRALARPIACYDPAIPGLDRAPQPADIVTCLDVLEHVEPECLDAVLDHLAALTRRAGLFVIATRPAFKHLPDGRNAHLVIEPAAWWEAHIARRFHVVAADRNGELEVAFLVAPLETPIG